MSWKLALINCLKDSEKVLYSDLNVAIIKDCYPKAESHFLVIPYQKIDSLKEVNREHLELLKIMDLKGKEFARENGAGRVFRYGYHAEPSMLRLHLHVISDDFNSPALKNKKHWNSFNTPFFIESSKVISDVESLGKVQLPSSLMCSGYLKTPLKCNKCKFQPTTLPNLKKHIVEVHLH